MFSFFHILCLIIIWLYIFRCIPAKRCRRLYPKIYTRRRHTLSMKWIDIIFWFIVTSFLPFVFCLFSFELTLSSLPFPSLSFSFSFSCSHEHESTVIWYIRTWLMHPILTKHFHWARFLPFLFPGGKKKHLYPFTIVVYWLCSNVRQTIWVVAERYVDFIRCLYYLSLRRALRSMHLHVWSSLLFVRHFKCSFEQIQIERKFSLRSEVISAREMNIYSNYFIMFLFRAASHLVIVRFFLMDIYLREERGNSNEFVTWVHEVLQNCWVFQINNHM